MTRSDIPVFTQALSRAEQDVLWQWVQRQFACPSEGWQRLLLNGMPLGRLDAKWAAQVRQDWPLHQQHSEAALALDAGSWLEMADALQHMAATWHKLGLLGGWRNEKFDVRDEKGQALFALERAAFRPLGLLSRAIHINGLACCDGEWRFWIGRRSPYKAVDPNKLDNLVGGGISSGECVQTAMLREGEEEAGLSATQLQHARAGRRCLSLRPVSRGLHREELHIFDVVLPEGVQPQNQDGEVAEFMLLSVAELAKAMAEGRLMNDALLATLDAFGRYGLLDPQHELAQWLARMGLFEDD